MIVKVRILLLHAILLQLSHGLMDVPQLQLTTTQMLLVLIWLSVTNSAMTLLNVPNSCSVTEELLTVNVFSPTILVHKLLMLTSQHTRSTTTVTEPLQLRFMLKVSVVTLLT
jgi:hypothetical protein